MKGQPINTLTVDDLEKMITMIVRKVIREEIAQDYYINEDGVKVLYREEEIDPAYLAELQQAYQEIESGKAELTEGEKVVEELRNLGLDL
jgi:flagellar biosynthesis component FlhA